MRTIVFSLGGSLIVPDEIDALFLEKFAVFVKKLAKSYNIIIVTGGGRTARKYISAGEYERFQDAYLSLVGIESTRLNASFVAGFFDTFRFVPHSFAAVRAQLKKYRIVVCGALGFIADMTSDGDAALLAKEVHAELFVNLTDVDGLFTKDPKIPGAKLVEKIQWRAFLEIAHKVGFKPGQHFVLDHKAAHMIGRYKIRTVIVNGHDLKNVEQCIAGKPFKGTLIYG